MSARRVSLLGALFVAIGPVSMALYTPAMTEIVEDLGSTEALVKLTLTLYFGGFACAQLVAGPLSDALGRRPVTFVFMAIFCMGSLLALVAPSVGVLMAGRFIQGIGASAGVAMSRAIVRDLFTGEQSARIMNLIGIILALGPAVAPTVGGLILTVASWRAIFVLMAVLGGVVFAAAFAFLRETVSADRSRLRIGGLLGSYATLLGSRHYLAAVGVIAGALGALYAQATFLPFILMGRVGLSPTEFGVGMLAQSGSFFAGSLVFRALMTRISAHTLVKVGLVFVAAGGLGLAPLLLWEPTFQRVMGPVAIYAVGIAFVMPGMTTAALAPFPAIAGAASSMMGFLQMGSGLAMGSLGAALGDPVLAMAVLIPMMGAGACLAYALYAAEDRRAPEPRRDILPSPQPGRTFLHSDRDPPSS